MDPSRVGLNAKTEQDFLVAASVNAAYIQLSAVVLQGVAILGRGVAGASTSAALYLSIVKSLAAEVVCVQPGSARRRLAQTGGMLALTDASTIAAILTSAATAAVAAGSVSAASVPSAASISAVATAVASINTAIASVTSSGITSSTSFLNAISALNGISYVSSTSLLASVNALADGTLSLASFSTATSTAALSAVVANTDIRSINAALYCSYLASATNDGGVSTSRNYDTLCLVQSPSPPPPSPPVDDLLWIIPLIVVTVVGLGFLTLLALFLVRRRRAEMSPGDGPPVGDAPLKGRAASAPSLMLLSASMWDPEAPGLRRTMLTKGASPPAAAGPLLWDPDAPAIVSLRHVMLSRRAPPQAPSPTTHRSHYQGPQSPKLIYYQ